ncbi:MAG: M56 family metallopeptidase [Alistipes sp.]|nr:M56 family metallopeptidase [Alistipes sp.]
MFDLLIYLAQSSLCLAALYLIYKVAMSHETLHVFNRVILLGSVILSALLPLCRVKVVKEYDAAPTVASIEVDDMVLVENVPELGVDYVSLFKDIAVAVFALGFLFMLLRLLVSIYSVWRLIHSGRMSVIEEDVTLTVVSKLSTPFSWFGHIVASEEDMREYRDMILSHELAHIRLRHSWDVMFADFALCLWWFNPAMWLLRRELQSLHEYQADEAVISNGVNAKNYQMLLIKRAAGARLHSVANCLNHSNLKNRITMMCKKTSSRWAATKALLVLPVVAISLSAFATTVYVPRNVQDKVTENSVNEQISQTESNASAMQESQQDDKPYIKVEKMPTFDGGKSLVGFQNWIQNNIRYPKEALAKGIGGRVIFQFVVERDGTPSSFNVLQSPDKSLADEVERVFKTSPKWEAGEQGGEKVRVLYTVPVVFTAPNTSANDAAKSSALVPLGDNQPYIKVEKMPTFQGGDLNAFRNWMQGQIQYPKEAMEKGISGRVIFQFVVERDGTPSSLNVLKSPDKSLADEVERIFKTCPKWEPGTQRGEKVRVLYTVPIVFTLPGVDNK